MCSFECLRIQPKEKRSLYWDWVVKSKQRITIMKYEGFCILLATNTMLIPIHGV